MTRKEDTATPATRRRGWRFGITAKLFFATLAVCILVLMAASLAFRWYFQQGFLNYLTTQENGRVEAFAQALAREYSSHNGWSFIREEGENSWRRLTGRLLRQQDDQERPWPENPAEAARRSYGITHLRQRLGLTDADKTTLIAGASPGPDALWTPVNAGERVVGWISRAPLSIPSDDNDINFQTRQRHTGWIILAVTLVLAAAASFGLARTMVRPLRRLGAAATALAGGDYTARARVGTKDELEALAGQFNDMATTLQRNENARRVFMAEIAHELRTPLAVLAGELEAMEDGVRKITPEAVASLQAEVGVLVRLVDDIHTLSLVDIGALAYDRKIMDLSGLVAGVGEAFRERMAARGLSLDTDRAGEEIFIVADRARISQVLNNILENSLRYTEPPGRVEVRWGLDQGTAWVDIADSSPGVAPDALELIFDRFHTTDPSRSRKSGGSGLGLSICRGIVKAHGGVISAGPSPLGGLRVRLELPAQSKEERKENG